MYAKVNLTFLIDYNSLRQVDICNNTLILPSPDFLFPPTDVVTRPLQVSTRCPRSLTEPLVDSSFMPTSSPALVPQRPLIYLLPFGKVSCSTCNPHPVYNFLSYHRLSLAYFVFVSTLSSVFIPKSASEALSHSGWKQAMTKEIDALYSNGTWELAALPPGKSPVSYR